MLNILAVVFFAIALILNLVTGPIGTLTFVILGFLAHALSNVDWVNSRIGGSRA